jgi:hypothetical protein
MRDQYREQFDPREPEILSAVKQFEEVCCIADI